MSSNRRHDSSAWIPLRCGLVRDLVATSLSGSGGARIPAAHFYPEKGRPALESAFSQGTAARLTVFGMALLQMQPEQVDWTGRGASAACGQMLGNKEERHGRRKNAAVSLFRALRRYPLTRALRCLSSLTPQDLGVSPEDAARARSRSGVAYQEIYAGADMTICIFLLRAGAQIPAHDHPGMHVFGRLLFGRMRVRSYDFIDGGESGVGGSDEPRRAHYYGEEVLGPAPVTYGLGPEEGNIHQIEAVDDCAFFDILTPPYNPCGGRNCNYFEVSVDSHRSDSRSAGRGYFLKPVLHPEFGMAARHEQRP
eukprot:s322_g18.t1